MTVFFIWLLGVVFYSVIKYLVLRDLKPYSPPRYFRLLFPICALAWPVSIVIDLVTLPRMKKAKGKLVEDSLRIPYRLF